MNFTLTTIVTNSNNEVLETRANETIEFDMDIPMDSLAEALDDAVSNSSQAEDWYNTHILTTIKFGTVVISAVVDYSFSSQYLDTQLVIDGQGIDSKAYENNQMDHEWNHDTASEIIWSHDDEILKTLAV